MAERGVEGFTLIVEDRVRQRRVEFAPGEASTIAELVAAYVDEAGLPTLTLDREAIAYTLLDEEGALLEPADAVGAELTGRIVRLESTRGDETWSRIESIIGQIEDEIGSTVRSEVDATVRERVDDVRAFLRAEASRRARGVAAHLDWRSRRRVRKLARQVGLTDAFPTESEDIVALLERIGPFAGRTARLAVPLVIGAGAATAGAAAVAVNDDDLTETDVELAIERALSTTSTVPAPTVPPPPDPPPDPTTATISRLAPEDLEALLAALVERDTVAAPILGGVTATATEIEVGGGDSLWDIAEAFRDDPVGCDDAPAVDEYTETLATYVLRVWAANLDQLGADPDALDVGAALRMPCPR